MKFPSKMLHWMIIGVAAALTIYSVSLLLLSNFNMGNLMVWLLTAALDIGLVFREPLRTWSETSAGRIVLIIAGMLCAVYLLLIAFVSVSGYANPPDGTERAIIVLGAGLHGDKPSKLLCYRLDKAYEYAVAHPDTVVVTSGGQGRDEWVPEGQAMRDYLIQKGLPAERVYAETASTSTEENFAFSLEILKKLGFSETTPIVYVSNAFHCYRAGRYAAYAGFKHAAALPAGTPWYSALPCYLREALALAYYWVFKTSATGPMHSMVGFLELNKRFFYK